MLLFETFNINVTFQVLDDGDFFELQSDYAKNIVVGFGRMNGRSVGIVGNQPTESAGKVSLLVV
jgi:propionyl-CoA carboxylase beta chain